MKTRSSLVFGTERVLATPSAWHYLVLAVMNQPLMWHLPCLLKQLLLWFFLVNFLLFFCLFFTWGWMEGGGGLGEYVSNWRQNLNFESNALNHVACNWKWWLMETVKQETPNLVAICPPSPPPHPLTHAPHSPSCVSISLLFCSSPSDEFGLLFEPFFCCSSSSSSIP